MRQVGILLPTSASDPEWQRRIAALTEALRTLGWTEGRNVALTTRYAEGKRERLPELAAELVAGKVDIIVTQSGATIEAARKATGSIPIVMTQSGDAVVAGLVASLARPGGNITGLTLVATDQIARRLQLVRDLSKDWRRVAALFSSVAATHRAQIRALDQAAPALGIEVQSFPNLSADDVTQSLRAAVEGKAQVIFTLDDPVIESHREQIVGFALSQRLPVIAEFKPMVTAGALLSYSPNTTDMWRRSAVYVDKILKGAKAADLPVEQPTRFELIINLKTAKTLGLEIPPTLLATADEVIE